MQLNHLLKSNGQPKHNGGCASGGKDCMIFDWFCDVGWGKVKMTWKFELFVKKPGGNYEEVINTHKVMYISTGEISSNVSCWVDNVLGSQGHKRLSYSFGGGVWYPGGTQFLNKVILEYDIEAGGDGAQGSASVAYNLQVTPFMNIESCSWELPETVIVHVPDWINNGE